MIGPTTPEGALFRRLSDPGVRFGLKQWLVHEFGRRSWEQYSTVPTVLEAVMRSHFVISRHVISFNERLP